MAAAETGIIAGIKRESSDILMIVAFIGILMAMILPLHPMVLDFFLALNISFAIVVLITTMYTGSINKMILTRNKTSRYFLNSTGSMTFRISMRTVPNGYTWEYFQIHAW